MFVTLGFTLNPLGCLSILIILCQISFLKKIELKLVYNLTLVSGV